MRRPAVLAAICALALTGCRSDRGALPSGASDDPVVTAALNDPLLTDPDLVLTSNEGAVLAIPDPLENREPPFDRSGEELRSARGAALQLAGGRFLAPPRPAIAEPGAPIATPMQAAARLPAARACLASATRTARWAASMPAAFPILPRGHVLDASGNDAPGCRLRAVRFVTPLPGEDAIGFYAARARAASFTIARRRAGEREVLTGAKAAAGWVVDVRTRGDGMTEVTLVTLG